MADHYQTLGVNKGASADEIKRAYRKLASQHHPDKGGDTAKFQQVEEAYRILSDPQQREEYDNPRPQYQGGHFGGGMPPGFEDIISSMFGGGSPFGFGHGRPHQPRNQTLNIQTTITLEEAFHGKDMIANLQLPSGRDQVLEVKIPAGINDGMVLRLAGMGDDRIQTAPKGDIHLTVNVQNHNKFIRQGDDLITELQVNCIDAMLGKKFLIETLDKKTLEITVQPGTQHGQMLSAPGYGMPKVNDNRYKGRLLIAVNITIPTLTDTQKQILKQINL
jgi:curved DNA-binding protein